MDAIGDISGRYRAIMPPNVSPSMAADVCKCRKYFCNAKRKKPLIFGLSLVAKPLLTWPDSLSAINERGDAFGFEKHSCHLDYLVGSDLVDVFIKCLDVFLPSIVQKRFAEVEGKLFACIAGNTYLSLDM